MTHQEILFTALIISLASLGFRAISSKGMIFYFLRQPFDKVSDKVKQNELDKEILSIKIMEAQKKLDFCLKNHESIAHIVTIKNRRELEDLVSQHSNFKSAKSYKAILYLAKPILLCSTCMASVHTLIWFKHVSGEEYTLNIVLIMLVVAFMNSVLYAMFEKLKK